MVLLAFTIASSSSSLLRNGLTEWLVHYESVRSLAQLEHLAPAQPGLSHPPSELTALPRRATVLPAHVALRERPHRRVVEDTNVGIHAHLERALAMRQANLLGRLLAAETGDVSDCGRVGALFGSGVQDGQTEADGGDATPGSEEVATCLTFDGLNQTLLRRDRHVDTRIGMRHGRSATVQVAWQKLELGCAR